MSVELVAAPAEAEVVNRDRIVRPEGKPRFTGNDFEVLLSELSEREISGVAREWLKKVTVKATRSVVASIKMWEQALVRGEPSVRAEKLKYVKTMKLLREQVNNGLGTFTVDNLEAMYQRASELFNQVDRCLRYTRDGNAWSYVSKLKYFNEQLKTTLRTISDYGFVISDLKVLAKSGGYFTRGKSTNDPEERFIFTGVKVYHDQCLTVGGDDIKFGMYAICYPAGQRPIVKLDYPTADWGEEFLKNHRDTTGLHRSCGHYMHLSYEDNTMCYGNVNRQVDGYIAAGEILPVLELTRGCLNSYGRDHGYRALEVVFPGKFEKCMVCATDKLKDSTANFDCAKCGLSTSCCKECSNGDGVWRFRQNDGTYKVRQCRICTEHVCRQCKWMKCSCCGGFHCSTCTAQGKNGYAYCLNCIVSYSGVGDYGRIYAPFIRYTRRGYTSKVKWNSNETLDVYQGLVKAEREKLIAARGNDYDLRLDLMSMKFVRENLLGMEYTEAEGVAVDPTPVHLREPVVVHEEEDDIPEEEELEEQDEEEEEEEERRWYENDDGLRYWTDDDELCEHRYHEGAYSWDDDGEYLPGYDDEEEFTNDDGEEDTRTIRRWRHNDEQVLAFIDRLGRRKYCDRSGEAPNHVPLWAEA